MLPRLLSLPAFAPWMSLCMVCTYYQLSKPGFSSDTCLCVPIPSAINCFNSDSSTGGTLHSYSLENDSMDQGLLFNVNRPVLWLWERPFLSLHSVGSNNKYPCHAMSQGMLYPAVFRAPNGNLLASASAQHPTDSASYLVEGALLRGWFQACPRLFCVIPNICCH